MLIFILLRDRRQGSARHPAIIVSKLRGKLGRQRRGEIRFRRFVLVAASLLSRCKTFAYGQSIQARREARQRGAEEALLRNTKGELCCGTVANLLVKRNGRWLTPPLSSGCLPGVMRGRCLALKLATEADVGSDLQPGDQAVMINSLGCRPIRSLDEQQLEPTAEPMQLWEQLLDWHDIE